MDTSKNNIDEVFLRNQKKGNMAYNKLLEKFGTATGINRIDKGYPSYYAGAYIGTEGNLVILTKEASISDIAEVKAICGDIPVQFESAKFSYNELISIMRILSERVQIAIRKGEYTGKAFTLSIHANVNKIYIGIDDVNDTNFISYLTSNINSNCYQMEYAAVLQEMASSLVPGDRIYGRYAGSTAYKAVLKINGEEKIGFLTAAHVTDGYNVYEGALHIGGKIGNTIVEQNAGSVDAAFVELTGSNTFTNTVEGSSIKANITIIPAPGSRVYKIGASSGITEGVVISNLNESYWDVNGVPTLYTNLVETDVRCEPGDSGGLMYTKDGSVCEVVGIIKGGGAVGKYYATKASYLPWNIIVLG